MNENVKKILNGRSLRSKLNDINLMTDLEKSLVLSAIIEYENYLTYTLDYQIRNGEVEIPKSDILFENESWRGMGVNDPLNERKGRVVNIINNVDAYQELSVDEKRVLLESLKKLVHSYDTLEAMVENNKAEYDNLLDFSDKTGSK